MERAGEEANAQESTRGGARSLGRPGAERGQKVGEPRKWPQGLGLVKSPQEKICRSAKRPAATAGAAAPGRVSAAISSIRARFGYLAIGWGYGGIRFSARVLG
jgi:hypothetical protein